MRIAAILPLRGLADGKQRLAGFLPAGLRRGIILALLDRVVGILQTVPEIATIVVVSPDAAALDYAITLGLTPLHQTCAGLNAGLDEAMAWAVARGYDGALIVLPDQPLVTSDAIQQVVSLSGALSLANGEKKRAEQNNMHAPGMILVPDRRGAGTNAMLMWPPAAMPCHFGESSYAAHRKEATKMGIVTTTLTLPDLAFDLDVPRDVRDLAIGHLAACTRLMWEAWRRRPAPVGKGAMIPSMKEGRQ